MLTPGQGFVQPAALAKDDAEVAGRRGRIGLEGTRAAETHFRFVEHAPLQQRCPKVGQGIGMIRVPVQGAPVSRLGEGEPAQEPPEDAQLEMQGGVFRLEPDRLLQTGLRLGEPAQGAKSGAEVGVDRWVRCVQGDGPGQEIDGGLALTHQEGEHSQQVQRIDLPGIHYQDLPIDVLRLGQAARLVTPHRVLQRFGQSGPCIFPCKGGDSRGLVDGGWASPWSVHKPAALPLAARSTSTAIPRR